MNITERALTTALTELLQECPLDKINVKDITDRCGLTRNTFYYHFHDVYDALNVYFTTEIEKMLAKYEHDKDWSGGFLEGLEHGAGVATDADGTRYEGVFVEGQRNGEFVVKDANGNLLRECTYNLGIMD